MSVTHENAIFLGNGPSGPLFAPSEQCALILGPPRSGKTSSVVVPNVIAANGSVVAVSTKRDVLETTARSRLQRGRVYLYDPSGTIEPPPGVQRVSWSPTDEATDWNRAVLMADAMVGASRGGFSGGESVHWNERAGALLSCMLHAAALAGAHMADLLQAVNRRETEQFLAVLARSDATLPLDLLVGITQTDARELSGIWSTTSSVLAGYRSDAALSSTISEVRIIPREFVSSTDTLFIAASGEHQRQFGPLVAGMIRSIRSAAFATTRRQGDAPVLLVLDELANIAPLHDLPNLVAEGASQGVLTIACLQDLSQARKAYGVAADGFLSLFGAKLVLGGIGDVRTLEVLSLIAGDVEQSHITTNQRRRLISRSESRSVSSRRTRRLPPDAIARPRAGTALVVLGAMPLVLELTPYYSSSPWREAIGGV